MASSVAELLQPQYILRVISRIRAGSGPLGRWLGFQTSGFDANESRPSGPNQRSTGATSERTQPADSVSGSNNLRGDVRVASYRIFDQTRVMAKARAPGTGPAAIARNPIGQVQVVCGRFHQKIPLNYEWLGNLSPIIGPNSQVDPGGEDYLMRQNLHLATQFNKAIEGMAAGMMRDSLYFVQANNGDDWYLSLSAPGAGNSVWPTTAPFIQVNFQVPATNKGQGAQQMGTGGAGSNPVIDVSWANAGANIFSHLMSIKAAYAQLTGYALTDVWINSTLWPNIIGNTQIRNLAGSSMTPFADYDQVPEAGMSGEYSNLYAAVLRADPTITWHFTDDVLVQGVTDVDPTYSTAPAAATLSKLVPDNMAIFCNGEVMEWCQMYLGSEYVVENPGMPGVKRTGMYTWKEYTTQPSNIDLIGLLNAVPMLFIPKIIAPLTVIFP